MLIKVELTQGFVAHIRSESISCLIQNGYEKDEIDEETGERTGEKITIGDPTVFIIFTSVNQSFPCVNNSEKGGRTYEEALEIFKRAE